MRVRVLAVVVCAAWAMVSAIAQEPQGTVTGVVTDTNGGVIPGAEVRLIAPRLTPRMAITDEQGGFRFDAVPPGKYEVRASLEGFKSAIAQIAVTANRATAVTLRLEVGALTETVTVMAQAVTMGSSASYSSAAIQEARRLRRHGRGFNTEAYDRIEDNPFKTVRRDPLSTFAIDVDTASYANVRRFLNDGELPPPDAVRVEELLNYFRFDYEEPRDGSPFSVATELAPCPWNPAHRLALIGLQARRPTVVEKKPRSLVFLLDVSGSMDSPDKLPLIRTAMRMLVDTLTPADRVAIVVYAGASGLVLPSTSGDRQEQIHQAIAGLDAGGSTNGGEGIALAYKVAQEQFVQGGVNRVILATDGDFNVGITNEGELVRLIEEKREAGVFLSVLGVGTGNLKDSTMEKLADKGNGNYSYLDSLHEARKVLIAEGGSTLETIAKDVKIQVEFNPKQVAGYRLIGYENRLLAAEDFNDDRRDAGEIGAGHTVTALYEIVPPDAPLDVAAVDALKYQQPGTVSRQAKADEVMTIKVRYKEPDGRKSRLMTVPVAARPAMLTANVGFAAAVAQFGMLLRESPYRGSSSFAAAADLARRFRGTDESGYRTEFVRLAERAAALTSRSRTDEPVQRTRR